MNPRLRGTVFEVGAGAATHPGLVRAENQDAWLIRAPVFLVADGMGGHESGRVAADLVVEAFGSAPWEHWATAEHVTSAAAHAGTVVDGLAAVRPGAPGSTLSGAALTVHEGAPTWLVFNIGDSRTYLLRDEVLDQVTVDHSEHQDLLDRGLSVAEADARTTRNVITRAIGGGVAGSRDPDRWLVPARVDDRVLICSDGLTGELSDPLIAALLMAHPDPSEAAAELVAAAVRSGGRDNVTAVVVDAQVVRGVGHPDLSEPDDTLETFEHDPLGDETRPSLTQQGVSGVMG
ncbi:serine/threonine-protein phosphatase [Nocardioides sp. JQ2195]|uniref:PP2C family protein-serine/threonine phosphatase n=1 Tax=Nocardioides sp. JQ2195 TaxID=2592334 RepID=UPI00143E4B16|nr:protein phosphatase 2C domain-containing protein [Nocardioides sp. JQ2195]QIX25406.1 serine/threonine-protein phosphatase [Nocardioides sp. JQ2195]